MIFSEEQIKRLPGSRVQLHDYPGLEFTVGALHNEGHSGVSFHRTGAVNDLWGDADKRLCFAATSPNASPRREGIARVLEWADENTKPIVINGTPVEVDDIWEDCFGEKFHITGVYPVAHSRYPIITKVETFSANGWRDIDDEGEHRQQHLVRCIEKKGKPYPPEPGPKTAREWLETIEHPEIKRRALRAMQPPSINRPNAKCKSLSEAFSPAFYWNMTEEGHGFWRDVAVHFCQPDLYPLPVIPGNGPLEVGMVFEGRAVESDGGTGDLGSRPIAWETFLDPNGQANLPGEGLLGRYGRSFRTEIRIVEELTNLDEYAKWLERRRKFEDSRNEDARQRAIIAGRKAARLGIPDSTRDDELPF